MVEFVWTFVWFELSWRQCDQHVIGQVEVLMVSRVVNQLCDDCLKRKTCDYVPASGRLLRCLDRQTTQAAENAPPHYSDSVSDPNAQDL
jgi:hypothetical protein